MAEQLGLEHLAWQGAAVNRHEGPLRADRALVDRPRHQLFAGSALAEHEHRRLRRRHALDHPQHLLHLGAAGDDAAVGPGPGGVGAQGDVVAQELALLGRLAHQDLELLDLGRLGQVVVGAELHGLHRGGDLLKARHDDDLRVLGKLLQLAQDLDALLLGHLHVEHDDVVWILPQAGQGRLAVAHALGLQAAPPELADDELAQVRLVVGHQDPDPPLHAGNTTRKILPFPTSVCISMRPP